MNGFKDMMDGIKNLITTLNLKYERMHEEDGEEKFVEASLEMLPVDSSEEFYISVHVISGVQSYKTMRVNGVIKKLPVNVLIDSRSTHNFWGPGIANKLRVCIQHTNPLTIVVADRTKREAPKLHPISSTLFPL
ncbi:hypothetical protein RHSIM_Rhsim06G0069200 [Rhododendron simsii]|uniref:Uncharacterized protein n=1 Tax=Rhododendron simsii TaxID=118357 RepID=A0A834H4W0_RHOSS|nr:hypothetical protein RHSIM_Rhsim06G0069200 [Rhododendron simsii]